MEPLVFYGMRSWGYPRSRIIVYDRLLEMLKYRRVHTQLPHNPTHPNSIPGKFELEFCLSVSPSVCPSNDDISQLTATIQPKPYSSCEKKSLIPALLSISNRICSIIWDLHFKHVFKTTKALRGNKTLQSLLPLLF